MVLKSIFWDKKRKYYTLAGVILLLLIVVVVVAITGKTAADNTAATYSRQLSEYVRLLKAKPEGATMDGDFANQPYLHEASFAFLSPAYQEAATKQAAVDESVNYLESVNDSYSPHKKGELRGAIFYYQSGFFYDRGSAKFVAARKADAEKSKLKQAAVYTTQFKAESKAASDYIASIEKRPAHRSLYDQEVTKLVNILRAYKKTADDCATRLKTAKAATSIRGESSQCNRTLQKQYDASEKYYDYIAFYPKEMKKFTPARILIEQIKKQTGLSYKDKKLETIRLKTRLNNKVAVIKTLLPKTKRDSQYDIKLAVVRTLTEQLEDDIKAWHISEQEKKSYQDALKQISTSLPVYDEPLFTFGDEPQTFMDKANAISRRIYNVSYEQSKTLSYFDFYSENKKQFERLETPGFIQRELQTILDNYDKALPYFKEYDDYNKTYVALSEKQEKAKDLNELLSILTEKRPLYDKMSEAKKRADVYIRKTDETVRTIQHKLGQIDALTKYTAEQYDKLLQ